MYLILPISHTNHVDHSQEPNIGTSAVPRPKAAKAVNEQSSSSTATAVQYRNQNNISKSVEPGGTVSLFCSYTGFNVLIIISIVLRKSVRKKRNPSLCVDVVLFNEVYLLL
jgi:hypothetical protein